MLNAGESERNRKWRTFETILQRPDPLSSSPWLHFLWESVVPGAIHKQDNLKMILDGIILVDLQLQSGRWLRILKKRLPWQGHSQGNLLFFCILSSLIVWVNKLRSKTNTNLLTPLILISSVNADSLQPMDCCVMEFSNRNMEAGCPISSGNFHWINQTHLSCIASKFFTNTELTSNLS